MTRSWRKLLAVSLLLFSSAACTHKQRTASALKPTAFGAALVESSGGKQTAAIGTALPQSVVIQVNDEQGTAVPGALVEFIGPAGVTFEPVRALTDSSGQMTTNIALGSTAGRYQLTAYTSNKAQKPVELKIDEIALGYQEQLGFLIENKYCASCHDQESTPERVSNYDNLEVKPHLFTDGNWLNKMSDDDLTAIISHGGPALNKSALMPSYSSTINKAEIEALISYIRLICDPPFRSTRGVDAKK
jgi:mono/diheme cytochrome c family protein